MEPASDIRKIAFLGNYLPRKCGIATFTSDLLSAVGEEHLDRQSFAVKTLDQAPRELPDLRLDHLARMTDSTGVFQHAIFTVPNFSEGHCTDDNARAFILAVMLEERVKEQLMDPIHV